MREINPLYGAIFFGTLLSALDKIGLKTQLISRQASGVLSQLLEGPAEHVLDGKHPQTVEELLTNFQKLNISRTLGKFEYSFSNGVITMKFVDCMYLPLNGFGKGIGYKACPMCAQALLLSAALKALNLGEVKDVQVENNENTCLLKIVLAEE
ncbi:MAG: hypothetical protein QXO71_07590 [Candidatus Jordarchaeaceae archaeon]